MNLKHWAGLLTASVLAPVIIFQLLLAAGQPLGAAAGEAGT